MQTIIYNLLNKFFMNEVENEIIKYLENRKKIIFDIGCYKGNFTKNFLKQEKRLEYKSSFYMFDPNPNVKKYINPILENDQIKYFDIAFDNTNAQKKFFLNNFFEPSGSSLSAIIKDDKRWVKTRKIFMKMVQPFNKIKDFTEISVKTKTLDTFCKENNISHIDLLKIDAEGNEENILLGAKELLKENKIHCIYVEIAETKSNYNSKENTIINYLKNYNFELKTSFSIKSFSFLSNLKATDNIFINVGFNGLN